MSQYSLTTTGCTHLSIASADELFCQTLAFINYSRSDGNLLCAIFLCAIKLIQTLLRISQCFLGNHQKLSSNTLLQLLEHHAKAAQLQELRASFIHVLLLLNTIT